MGRRNLVYKYPVWTALDSTTPAVSEESFTDQLDIVKYIVKVDVTVDGSISVEFLDDKPTDGVVPTWDDLDFGQPILIVGATETEYTLLIEKHASRKMRLSFTNNGGTGDINAWFSGYQVGA